MFENNGHVHVYRPVYIESCSCVVRDGVKCSFECLSVVHHTCLNIF